MRRQRRDTCLWTARRGWRAGLARLNSRIFAFVIVYFSVLATLWFASDPAIAQSTEEDPPDFAREVLPILSDKCFACHGPDAETDSLKLTTYEEATRLRDGIRAIDSSAPERSELLLRIHDQDAPMPPEDADKQLTAAEKVTISQWVRAGGRYAQHWAFVLPQRHAKFQRIDEFIEQELRTNKLGFAPEAEPHVLARRVALVLTGLPPSVEAVAEYLKNPSHDELSKLVEKLLDSAAYGEHQARYWLDAVRYGDTAGLARDVRRGVYPYRDWVIQTLNDNQPLDQFITWQFAGDMLPDPTLEQLVATGYIRLNQTTNEGGSIPAEFQAKNNFDRVENLGAAFLGLSLNCARCHTHKYDPVTQREYYELLAFFNNTAEKPLDDYKYDHPPVVRVPRDIADWREYRQLQLIPLPSRSNEQKTRLEEIAKRMTTSLVAKEGRTRKTFVLAGGDYQHPLGSSLDPGVPATAGELPIDAPPNRLGLAQWLTSPQNPPVARVLVNRIWQQVFGHGIVRTPEDFGVQGEYPTHPELLDHLAVDFQENGWNLKRLLKQMVLSRTFCQSSYTSAENLDPENRLLARGPNYRLDAEVIRDTTLFASGLLDDTMGGEGVKPYQPAGLWKAIGHRKSNTRVYKRDTGDRLYRRSIYVYWKRASPHPLMTLFDAPNRESACVRRSRTDTPLQSLALLNETGRIEAARMLAEKLILEAAEDRERLDLLFLNLTCRRANSKEATACLALLENMRSEYEMNRQLAVDLLSVGDVARNKKLDVIDVASWTHVVSVVLASDPVILLY